MKIQMILPTGQMLTTDVDSSYKILPNFEVFELANVSAKEDIKLVIDERAWKLLQMLQLTRYRYGRMKLNSVYRTTSFNATVEGADTRSCHVKCWAFDWSWSTPSKAVIDDVCEWWKNLCTMFNEIGAINIYKWGFHCEIGSDIQYGSKSFQIRDRR